MNTTDIMAIADRRAKLERDLRAEGATESQVERLATDDTAAKMLACERRMLALLGMLYRRGTP